MSARPRPGWDHGRMRYAEHVADLVGNTPLVRLGPVAAGHRAPRCWPRSSTSTPAAASRTASRCAWSRPRRRRASCAPAARSSSRPPATPASGWRSWPSARGTAACSSARTRSARTSATCSRPTAPRSWSARPRSTRTTPTPTTARRTGSSRRSTGAWKPNQYANPENPQSHYLGTGPELWEQTEGRITHFVAGIGTGGTISGTGRYLKEVSDGRVQVIGADPEGSVYSGGTGRPYLVEGVGEDFWPTTYDKEHLRPDRRGLRRRLVRHDPAAGPRGGAAGRRVVRDGDGGGAAGRGRAAPTRPATPWSSCCCPTAAAATSARSSTTRGWPATASCRPPQGATVGDVLRRKDGAIPALVHAHPNETVPTPCTTCASSTSRRCPWCAPSRR